MSKTKTFQLPAPWALVLINGDFSGVPVDEALQINAWLRARPELGACLSCGPAFFINRGPEDMLGGWFCDFTFPVQED